MVFWSVQVGWFVGGVNECTFFGWWWLGAKVRVRWETDGVCGGRCVIRVTSMRYIKSIRMFEDDVTSPEEFVVIEGGSLGGLGWWSDVCNLQNVLPSSGCLSILLRVLRPSFLAGC